jgi:hypothetical protein
MTISNELNEYLDKEKVSAPQKSIIEPAKKEPEPEIKKNVMEELLLADNTVNIEKPKIVPSAKPVVKTTPIVKEVIEPIPVKNKKPMPFEETKPVIAEVGFDNKSISPIKIHPPKDNNSDSKLNYVATTIPEEIKPPQIDNNPFDEDLTTILPKTKIIIPHSRDTVVYDNNVFSSI